MTTTEDRIRKEIERRIESGELELDDYETISIAPTRRLGGRFVEVDGTYGGRPRRYSGFTKKGCACGDSECAPETGLRLANVGAVDDPFGGLV